MLKGQLIHPEILAVLGTLGHGSRILISDGNYPVGTRSGAAANVFLNLSPGVLNATQVLEAVASAVPIEAVSVMVPDEGPAPPIFSEFQRVLDDAGAPTQLTQLDRYTFYDEASDDDVGLAIHTAEQRIYANVLLTIGVIAPPEQA